MRLDSSIWNRLIGPVIFSFALAALIEGAVQLKYHPDFWQKTTWLVHDPYRGEAFDRVMLYQKLSKLGDTRPEIISVGDSSGFWALQSKIANHYTNGVSYLSLNTGANQAYLGYRSIAEYMLRRPDSRIKWVVIYAFPQLGPTPYLLGEGTLSPYIYDAMVGPLSYVTPPTAFLSPYAKFRFFDGIHWHFSEPMTTHVAALQLRAQVKETLGWLGEFDVRRDRIRGHVGFFSDTRRGLLPRLGLAERSSAYTVYEDFYRMVTSYGARLAIAFAPISERAILPGDPHIAEAERAMARFSHDHPDVKFLFPFISRWHPEKFGEANHVSREYTFLSSMRLGRALGRLATDPESFPAYVPQFRQEPEPPVTHEITGPADAQMLKSAFAFYLYAQTADESYKKLISRRVLALLENDEAFHYMLQEARGLQHFLGEKKIEAGFDFSQMRARPLSVTGMPHCNQQPATQWVQVDGTLNFTYKSPEVASSAGVAWPETSNIYFPLIKEDGILKFDGYCPETGLALSNAGDPEPAAVK